MMRRSQVYDWPYLNGMRQTYELPTRNTSLSCNGELYKTRPCICQAEPCLILRSTLTDVLLSCASGYSTGSIMRQASCYWIGVARSLTIVAELNFTPGQLAETACPLGASK